MIKLFYEKGAFVTLKNPEEYIKILNFIKIIILEIYYNEVLRYIQTGLAQVILVLEVGVLS